MYLSLKYSAAVAGLERSRYARRIILVSLPEVTYQPFRSSKVTLFRLLQLKNAQFPILVTLSGIVILVRLLQDSNAKRPMLVTLLGITMRIRLLQVWNA